MKPGIAALLTGLIIVGIIAGVPAAAAVGGVSDGSSAVDSASIIGLDGVADNDDETEFEGNESEVDENASDVRPGERLGGVVGVQASEINEEVDAREFERRVGADRSEAERADAVAERLEDAEARLEEIDRRHAELRELREAGEISEGEFRARTARLAAETRSIERATNRSGDVANDLPAELREERGIDAERVDTLRNRANELSGPEVAAIAREIAGPNAGGPVGADRRPAHAGPPGEEDGPGMEDGPGAETPGNMTPGNASAGEGSGDDAGPPDDAGQGEGSGDDAGPPDDAGSDDAAGSSGNGEGSGPPSDAGESENADEESSGESDDAPGGSDDAPGGSDDAPGGSDDAPGENGSDDSAGGDSSGSGNGSDGASDDAGNGGASDTEPGAD